MAIVNTNIMLRDAKLNHYAVGAFNIENMEFAQAIIWAANSMHSPIILQTSENTLKYASPTLFCSIVQTLAKEVSIPVAIHLDHGTSYASVLACVNAGYKSIMYDGSMLPYKNNIEVSKRLVNLCNPQGISVEAEIGAISGKEGAPVMSDSLLTDPDLCASFVKETGIDSVAVSIGTVHGMYKSEPKIDFERLRKINSIVEIPLVLHGASGLSTEQLVQCIDCGISKINIATDLRYAWTEAIKTYLQENPSVFDPKKASKVARERIQEVVCEKIRILRSENRV